MTDSFESPYVGPRPFRTGEDELFFGRDAELQHLASLVVAHRLVLLFSPSGAGKSSLINAALLAEMESMGFATPPPLRLLELSTPRPEGDNPIVTALLRGLTPETSESLPDGGLGGAIAAQVRDGDGGEPSPVLIVLDQFEEVFTLFPEARAARAELLAELEAALRAVPVARVLLSFREEVLAELDFHLERVDVGRVGRYRLEPLRRRPAITAVREPALRAGRPFAPGVPEELVRDLARVRVTRGGSTVEVDGEFVEPVHLQVSCQRLWASTRATGGPITAADLEDLGDVDETLRRHYDDAVTAAAAAGGVRERDVRRGVERSLITPSGTRGLAFRGPKATGELPNRVADELQARHVIRAEPRASGTWYELVHDRILKPVRESNASSAARWQRIRALRITAVGLAIAVVIAIASVSFVLLRDEPAGLASVEPPQYDFGPVTKGDSVSQPLTLAGKGDERFTIVAFTPPTSDHFNVEAQNCQGGSFSVSCKIQVTFKPESAEEHSQDFEATYRIEGEADRPPRTGVFTVKGAGAEAEAIAADEEPRRIQPKRYHFGNVPVGQSKLATLTLSGPPDQRFTINSFSPVESPNFSVKASDCGGGSFNASCDIEIRFTPPDAANYSQRFALTYRIEDEPDQHLHTDDFSVSGTGA